MQDRFIRNSPAVTLEQQVLLWQKRVCVVGCGGLGEYIAEYLARLGIGRFTLMDGDRFEPSNLNRQLLCTEGNIGQMKAVTAAERILSINRDISVSAITDFFTAENSRNMLHECDIVMDALDNPSSRIDLAEACEALNIPLIHGAIQAWTAQITVCMPGSGRISELYRRGDACHDKCSLSFTPPLCAAIQAAEALKLLCGSEPSLSSRMLIVDLKSMEFDSIIL